jgi:hypothetical protein
MVIDHVAAKMMIWDEKGTGFCPFLSTGYLAVMAPGQFASQPAVYQFMYTLMQRLHTYFVNDFIGKGI